MKRAYSHEATQPEPGLPTSNAFKSAEKRYKLYKGVKTDLSDVIDFSNRSNNTATNAERIVEVADASMRVYSIRGREGFYVLPNALSEGEQWDLATKCLMDYNRPPNRTNLDLHYGPVGDRIVSYYNSTSSAAETDQHRSAVPPVPGAGHVPTPRELADKLRWTTLGYQYDWTRRRYSPEDYVPFPKALAALVCALAQRAGSAIKPEAAIVNYYAADSTLGGHLDDAEQVFDAPIVSISVGNTGIFLLGGKTKDEPPLAVFLPSGSVVLMGGESRLCYHGVPRILANTVPASLISSERPNQRIAEFLKTSRINLNIRQVYPMEQANKVPR